MLAAIGDGISALSNLYFTSQYAPNAFDPSTSMSARTKARWDKINAEREANRRAFFNDYLRAAQMDEEKEYRDKEAEHRQEREAKADAAAKAAADYRQGRDKIEDDFKERELKAKEDEAKNKKDLNERKFKLEQDKLGESRRHNRSMEGIAAKRAARAGSGGDSSKGGGKPYGTFLGKTYKTKADYDRAVVAYAKANRIPLTYGKVSTDAYGMKRTTQTNRTIPGLAAEAEEHNRKKNAAKPKPKTTARQKTKAKSSGGWASGLKI